MRRNLLVLLALTSVSIVFCQRRAYNQSYSNLGQGRSGQPYIGYGAYAASSSIQSPTSAPKPLTSRSAGGIGAWGYVAILLTVILAGTGIYYFVLFYPIVCKKERMYDVMEMTTV